jgi:hypothetical protein
LCCVFVGEIMSCLRIVHHTLCCVFVGEIMSCLRIVHHTLCCVFALFFFVSYVASFSRLPIFDWPLDILLRIFDIHLLHIPENN